MKKVLIITYYWPPSAGIAVLRCLKIAKYLRQSGWEPIILAPEGADYPGIDESNFKDIPEGIEVIRVKIWEPYKIYRKLTGQKNDTIVNNVFYSNDKKTGFFHKLSVWVRSNFFIPDARCFWIKPAVKVALDYMKDHQVDAVFSDGPPHTNTRIACILKQKTGIPWLADFQDPWTQVDYYQMLNLTKWGDKKHKNLEQEVFNNADAITIVSKAWKKDLESIGARNVSVAYWGYDPDDYILLNNVEPDHEYFTITHAGILGHDRKPSTLFKILNELCKDDKFKSKLRIQLIGQVDLSVKQEIEKNNLIQNTFFTGNLTRTEAMLLCKKSSLLLLLLNQQTNSAGRVPGKLFEYLALKRSIICLGNTKGDSAEIIEKSKSGKCADYSDEHSISIILNEKWNKFKANELTLSSNNKIDEYSVINSVNSIANILNQIIK